MTGLNGHRAQARLREVAQRRADRLLWWIFGVTGSLGFIAGIGFELRPPPSPAITIVVIPSYWPRGAP